MRFWNPFKRKTASPRLVRKSYVPLGAFSEYLTTYGHHDLAAYATVSLFDQTAPLSSAVDILSSEFSSLKPIVKEKKGDKEEIVSGHPVLDLLKRPNADSTGSEFLYRLAAFYLITGNTYLTASGDVRREPLEIYGPWPQQISYIQPDDKDGFAAVFNLETQSGGMAYKRDEIGGVFRYYFEDWSELWQVKRFNPNKSMLVGQTPVSAILPEIDWYNLSSTHNVSLLKRGARPSGILTLTAGKASEEEGGDVLTEDQYKRLVEQFQTKFAGASNSGKPVVFDIPDREASWETLLTTNQEMDFISGRRDTRETIYVQYKIPLPFISSSRQTFSNMETANDQLYDNGVLPLADRLFEELNLFLLPRYKRSENLTLTYDESAISALNNRKTREVKEKGETGIYTINELRTMAGMEKLDEGGDMLYRPASMVPISRDRYTDDQFDEPQK